MNAASRRRHRLGMTLTEAVIGLLVVAVAVGGALQATTVARLETIAADDRVVARSLITALHTQMSALCYRDPQSAFTTFGPDAGESTTGPAGWDDVDDAHGWSGMPTIVTATSDWSLTVSVSFANAASPAVSAVTETGLKRISVTARRGQRVILTEEFLRAIP